MIIITITIIISFLFGSIPTGYLVVERLYGIDIRTKGSGNIGSTNVKRVAGTKASIFTQIIDILKAIIPVGIGIFISRNIEMPIATNTFLSIIAIVVILGHDYTPFLALNGGKGVNTTMGAFILFAPIPTMAGIVVYFTLRFFTSIVSIRSITLGMTIAISTILMKMNTSIIISTLIASVLIIIRHKDNLKRLISREEK